MLVSGTFASIGGLLTLLGWITGVYRLTDWAGIGISMKANPAIAAIAAGSALLLAWPATARWRQPRAGAVQAHPRRWAAPLALVAVRVLGAIVAIIGGLTLLQHVADVDLGIDTLVSSEPWGTRATAAPGRMGPPASLSFTLVGTALILLAGGRRARRLAAMLAAGVAFIAGASLAGYGFGAAELYAAPRLTGIAVQMATILFVLAVGIGAAVPERGLAATLLRGDAGGLMARRLVLPVVLVPLLVAWLRLQGEFRGWFDATFGTAVVAVTMVVILLGFVMWTARTVGESDAQRRETDRRKDQFLATLAHELRNPLAPIRNSLEIIRRSADNPRLLHTAEATMDRQLQHMVRLIDDLLDVSRISRDKLVLRREPEELGPILRDAIEVNRPAIDAGQLALNVEIPTEPIYVNADRVRLAQAFGNLISNACKFTAAGGRIHVTVAREASTVTVAVRDTGIGIAPEHLPQVFELFVQADHSLERSRGGLGIGLSLARRLVEMHGGTLSATSDGEGHGSEFVVRLPLLKHVSSGAEPAVRPAGIPVRVRRVLVVDDNRDAVASLAELLRLRGHEVRTAGNGWDALTVGSDFEPEVIVLDIGMPGLNGYDTCRAIGTQPWGKSATVIALTGWGKDEDRRHALEAGFDWHMVKPADPDALTRLIATSSGRATRAPAAV
ncbi:MAG TPA: ATP-binding protein [Gemmatimonadaceae bacterium]